MKKICGIIALAILSIAVLVCIAPAAAYDIFPEDPTISANGNVWQFDTRTSVPDFSGNDVVATTIVATYFTQTGGSGSDPVVVVPKNIVLNDNKVQLVFDPEDLPVLPPDTIVLSTQITGTLTDGRTFIATGPGFAFGRRP
ncbi:hypothetical protein MUP77_17830 [Candidatus Bathyarchaeota archaeon]|nr:hypothetical protein [Candidatus Bathyarchaeota archaeon]